MTRKLLNIASACLAAALGAACSTAPKSAAVAPVAAEAATPAAARMVTGDGVELAYTLAGRGAPAVFVHGGPGSGSHAFRLLSDGALERHFRIAWLDQRGSGASGGDASADYSIERQVADLEELRQRLGHDRWTLVAYSFGGLITQAYANAHPDRVAAIVHVDSLLNLPASMESSVRYGLELVPADRRPQLDPAMPLPQRYFMVMGLLGQAGLADRLQYSDDGARERAKARLAASPAPARNAAMAQAIFRGNPGRYIEDFTASTASTGVPVLVIAGKDDRITGPTHHQSFLYPRKAVALLDGGHMAFYEDPAGFERAVAAFAASLLR